MQNSKLVQKSAKNPSPILMRADREHLLSLIPAVQFVKSEMHPLNGWDRDKYSFSRSLASVIRNPSNTDVHVYTRQNMHTNVYIHMHEVMNACENSGTFAHTCFLLFVRPAVRYKAVWEFWQTGAGDRISSPNIRTLHTLCLFKSEGCEIFYMPTHQWMILLNIECSWH